MSAPDNVAYDHHYREFVYRQPRSEAELAAIMRADSEEVFSCYRFDGLARWTHATLRAWIEDIDVVVGYTRDAITRGPETEIDDSLREYGSYLTSSDFKAYLGAFSDYLHDR
jgi:hypothetical protein